MSSQANTHCRQCGALMRADESFCARCLLGVAATDDTAPMEERIFQQALALEPGARIPFIREATRENSALFSAVKLLLAGYEEAGGDAAQVPPAREQGAAAHSEEPGAVIDHFRLVRLLGEGGMGSVWLAEQTTPVKRTVALKVIKLGMDTREVVKRFQRERQTLALLRHPNIAQVFEAGATASGRPYFAMELVEGQSMVAFCEKANLDLKARLRLFQDVCAAVEHAHQKGVIHRDLKPSNILVADGAVKVIDFGVARATQSVGDTPLFTRQAQILGTPAYMSPEQANSAGVDIDTRTDVFSLGVVLYEILTGALPIDPTRLANTSVAEMQRILMEEEPPTPSKRITALDSGGKHSPGLNTRQHAVRGDLDWVVMKAIRKDRNERYASAAALSEDLRRYLAGEPVSAVPPTLTYRAGKFVRRNRVAVAAGAVVMLSLVTALIVSLLNVHRANQALAGEAKAREETTFTLADMYARSGLTSAENGDPTRAALWFANAAVIGASDPERAAANRLRATAWRQDSMTAVRAFDTGFEHLRQLIWNPRHPAMIVESENDPATQVWDLEKEQLWPPLLELKPSRAAWDPTGERLAVLLPAGVVVLSFPSGTEIARLPAVITDNLTWSPDGRWIASANLIWDWQRRETRALPKSAGRIRFSRDGRRLLLQWESQTGICAVDMPGQFLHPPVASRGGDLSDFLGDGQTYVVGRQSGELVIHDSTTGKILATHAAGTSAPDQGPPLVASADGRLIARQSMAILDRANPRATKFPIHQGLFTVARFSPDDSLLASGGYDLRLELWSVTDGKFLGEVGHHHNAVINLEFSPDGKFVASGEDGLVRVWRVTRGDFVRKIPASETTRAALSPDGKLVAASGFSNENGSVKKAQAFDLATGRPASPEIVPGGLLMDAVFSNDGTSLALAVSTTQDRSVAAFEKSGGTGNVQIWNRATGQRLGEPIPVPSEPRGLCWHPSGQWIGVACAGGQGVEIELASRTARVLFDHRKPSHANATLNNGRCAYSPDGRVFAVWGLIDFIHLRDRDHDRELIEKTNPDDTTFDLAFHGNTVARALVASKMRIEFHDLRSGAEAAPAIPYSNWPFLTRFSADGNLLLTAGGGRTAQVWDWRRGRLVCPMLPHDDTIMAGCFVPGTPWVITGGHDGKIKFWDRRTGMMIRPPLQRNGWVLELQLTPDARTLVASGELGGSIELIDLPTAFLTSDIDPAGARLLSEIDADAEVHPGGGLAKLTPQAWLKKWREFRERYPTYAGHQLAN